MVKLSTHNQDAKHRPVSISSHPIGEWALSPIPSTQRKSPNPVTADGTIYGEDPGYLISPLPDFTCLPNGGDIFSALPELDGSDQSIANVALSHPRCGAAGCPFSCKCQPVLLFDEETGMLTASPLGETRTPALAPTAEQIIVSEPLIDSEPSSPQPTSRPSLLSMTAPQGDCPGRIAYTNPSHHRSPSRPPTRPSTPLTRNTSTPVVDVSASSSAGLNIPAPRDSEGLRTRLRDLLHDSTPVSTSLPNLPPVQTHTDTKRGRDAPHAPHSRSSSRSGSFSSQRPLPIRPMEHKQHTNSSLSYSVTEAGPSSVDSMSASSHMDSRRPHTVSRASEAAQALEKLNQREKKEQEERRRAAGKEREQELHRRSYVDSERPRRERPPPSTSSTSSTERKYQELSGCLEF